MADGIAKVLVKDWPYLSFKFWVVHQNSIPNVWQIIFTSVLIEGGPLTLM